MNRDDYISFVYYEKNIDRAYLKHFGGFLEINCNRIDLLDLICFRECIYDSLPEKSNVTGIIWVYVDTHLFTKRISRENYDPNEFVPKTNDMYIPDVTNEVYDYCDTEIRITHYPFPGFAIFNKNSCNYSSLVLDAYDCIYSLKNGIKKCLAHFFLSNGFFPVHAAAVEINGRGELYLASTRSGKTTLYANLTANGGGHISDDIAFIKQLDGELYTFSVPLLPSLRQGSLQYLTNNVDIESKRVYNEDGNYFNYYMINNLKFSESHLIPIGSFSFLNQDSSFKCIDYKPDSYVKKLLIKCLTWHIKNKPDINMLNIVNLILHYKWHRVCLSPDPYENLKGLVNMKGEHNNYVG